MTVAEKNQSLNRSFSPNPGVLPVTQNAAATEAPAAQNGAAAKAPVMRSRSPSPTNKTIAAPLGDEKGGFNEESGLLGLVPKKPYRFNDSHMHPSDYRQNGRELPDVIVVMDELGVQFSTLMPLPTSLINPGDQAPLEAIKGRCGCEPRYYLPKTMRDKTTLQKEDVEIVKKMASMYLDTAVDYKTAANYKQLSPEQQYRFDPMITGLHIGNEDCSNRLLETLYHHKGVFTGVGEITVHKEVVEEILAQKWANLTTNVNPLLEVLRTCGKIGMPVVLHCDIGHYWQGSNDVPAHLADLKKLFSHAYARDTTIIWAHAGGIGRFVGMADGHVKMLGELLGDEKNYPNLHIDLSWDVVAEKLFKIEGQLEAWAELINQYPTRFIFGSDCVVPETSEKWNSTYTKYEQLIAKLAEKTVEAVFTDNYKRIFVNARARIRNYENTDLDKDFKKLNPYYNPPVSAVASRPMVAGPVMTAATRSASSSASNTSSRAQEPELELENS